MNRKQLIAEVSTIANIRKVDVRTIVQSVTDVISAHLKKGESVSIFGFGKFYVRKRPARPGVNPRTGAKIRVAASRIPRFKAGKALRKEIQRQVK